MNFPNLDSLLLVAHCFEWRLLYEKWDSLSEQDKLLARVRMSDLSGKITALENKTRLRSRDIG